MIRRFRKRKSAENAAQKGFDDYAFRIGDVMRGERATMGKSLLDVQSDLKIKATYIAAIENADPTAFETPGFIAGYVRSYARYLALDPDWAFKSFCDESGFQTVSGMSPDASSQRQVSASSQNMRNDDLGSGLSFAFTPQPESFLSRIDAGAVGSVAVLVGLIGLIGYGGFSVLRQVQQVEFSPVEQTPAVVAELDAVVSAQPISRVEENSGLATQPGRAGFDRIYAPQPQPLDVPIFAQGPRDAAISTLRPDEFGALATTNAVGDGGATVTSDQPSVQVSASDLPEVALFAVRETWVRVQSAEGTTIYEKLMQPGEYYELPETADAAKMRTGESGSVYFAVNGTPYGPAGQRGQVTRNLSLAANSLTEQFNVADLSADDALRQFASEKVGELLLPLEMVIPEQVQQSGAQ